VEMTRSPLNNNISQLEAWERTPSYAPTSGDFGRERTPSTYGFSSGHIFSERSTPLPQSQPGQLSFLDEPEWNSEVTDDENQSYIQYVIEWRAAHNNRVLERDTEQGLVSKPSSYWQEVKQKAEDVLCRKITRKRRVRSDDTTVVVSVNDRSQRDLTKRLEKTDINWTAIERQLLMWKKLFHQGKKLRLSISINYIEDSNPSPSRKTDKRGTSSATKRMLAEREDQIDAEVVSGQPSVWQDVYRKMRCPRPPCTHEGQYCWQDPVGKKHYKLRTHHMRTLVKYVEQRGFIETHDDIPDTIRDELYAEERQRIEKQQSPRPFRKWFNVSSNQYKCAPDAFVQPLVSSVGGIEAAPSRTIQVDSIDIPGPLEVAVR
jgi:hypothetical protein